jgi:hypothetical protein
VIFSTGLGDHTDCNPASTHLLCSRELSMFHLDYISCALTVVSTCMVGRRMWQGWIVAGVNSVILCVIGFRTMQVGLIPANLFCLAIYAYNVSSWRKPVKPVESASIQSTVLAPAAERSQRPRVSVVHERTHKQRSRIRRRALPVGR